MDATHAIQTYLATASESQFAGQSVDVVANWQGAENLLWRVECAGRQAVLKLFLDAGQVRSRRQFEAQQLFYPAGFAALPLWYEWQPEGLSRPVLVYEWIEGQALVVTDHTAVMETARILATIHARGINELGRLSPNPVSLEYYWRLLQASIASIDGWLAEDSARPLHAPFNALAQAARSVIEQALPIFGSATPSAIHGDPKLENFIQSGGSVTLFDWERSGLGDPALEVATFLFRHMAVLEANAVDAWFATYLTYAVTPDIEQRVDVYRRIIPFQSVCFLLDGLRELSANDDALIAHQAELPFLQQTLTASLRQAADRLETDIDDIDPGVAEIFEQVGSGVGGVED